MTALSLGYCYVINIGKSYVLPNEMYLHLAEHSQNTQQNYMCCNTTIVTLLCSVFSVSRG